MDYTIGIALILYIYRHRNTLSLKGKLNQVCLLLNLYSFVRIEMRLRLEILEGIKLITDHDENGNKM